MYQWDLKEKPSGGKMWYNLKFYYLLGGGGINSLIALSCKKTHGLSRIPDIFFAWWGGQEGVGLIAMFLGVETKWKCYS